MAKTCGSSAAKRAAAATLEIFGGAPASRRRRDAARLRVLAMLGGDAPVQGFSLVAFKG